MKHPGCGRTFWAPVPGVPRIGPRDVMHRCTGHKDDGTCQCHCKAAPKEGDPYEPGPADLYAPPVG